MTPSVWLPASFVAPALVPLVSVPYHLRPIHPDDTVIDMVAVMGSRERLWSIYGKAWGWPPSTMTAAADREDLARHADEMKRNESFNYALLDADETALFGCVYIDPPERAGADADISWWVIDDLVAGEVEAAFDDFVPAWISAEWPFESPRFIGRDLSWDDWIALPKI